MLWVPSPDSIAPLNTAPECEHQPSTSWRGAATHQTSPRGQRKRGRAHSRHPSTRPLASRINRASTRFGLATIHRFRRHPHRPSMGSTVSLQRSGANCGAPRHHRASAGFTSIFPAPDSPCRLALHGYNYSVYPTDDTAAGRLRILSSALITPPSNLPPHIYPGYMQERMVPEHLVGDATPGLAARPISTRSIIPPKASCPESFCTGAKCLFITRCIAPETAPHDLHGLVTAQNGNGPQDHEMQVVDGAAQERSSSTPPKRMDIQRWVADAPFHQGGRRPQESPDRWVGTWAALGGGLHVRHPEMTLPELMDKTKCCPFCSPTGPRPDRGTPNLHPWPTTAPPTST